jgi:hypothetical protein
MSFAAAQRTITVSGVVVDSVTMQPVPNATVLLLDTSTNIDTSAIGSIDISKLKPDSVLTTANGSFSKPLTVPYANIILAYMVVKEGYFLDFNFTLMLSTTINLDTIKLIPNAIAPKDTVTVSGTIVDSTTGIGIPGALIGLSGGDLDTAGKTAVADNQGNFSRQVIVSKVGTFTIVGYIAYKDGYNPAVGTKNATGKTVDLGIIKLLPNTQVRWTMRAAIPVPIRATNMTLYSLNGQRIYTGPGMPLKRAIRLPTSAVVADFKMHGTAIGRKKVIPAP